MGRLLGLLLLLVAAPAAAQGPEALAQRRFEEGSAAYQAGRHPEALEAFRASNELFPSPNTRLLIARSLRELGRIAEAWGEFQLVVAGARGRPRYREAFDAATSEGRPLLAQIARVRVELQPSADDASIEIQGRSYPAAALVDEVAVDPGVVEVRASAPGYVDAMAELSVAAGQVERVSLTLEPSLVVDPPVTASEPWEPLGFTFGGLAVVSAVLWPVFWALANDRFDTAQAMCPENMCPPSAQSLIDEGRAFEATTNAMWIGALGTTALSVTFLLLAWL